METRIQIGSLLTALFVFFLVSASTIQAEEMSKDNFSTLITEVSPQMISAGAVLEHNKRLLHETTIGSDLKKSKDQRVMDLYEKAHKYFREAVDAHKSGREDKARELSYKSIGTFYEADKEQYKL